MSLKLYLQSGKFCQYDKFFETRFRGEMVNRLLIEEPVTDNLLDKIILAKDSLVPNSGGETNDLDSTYRAKK